MYCNATVTLNASQVVGDSVAAPPLIY